MGPDYYVVLGVAPEADAQEITHAFRQLIRTLHPDAAGAPRRDQAAAERLRQVLAAWNVLHDPSARAAYDRARRPPATRVRTQPHPGDGPDLIAGPTVLHAPPGQPAGPHLRVGPPIRLDD